LRDCVGAWVLASALWITSGCNHTEQGPSDLSATADLATGDLSVGDLAGDCAGPPVVRDVSPQTVLPCQTLTLVGDNLRCPGTRVQILQQDVATIDGADGAADGGASDTLTVRVPVVRTPGGVPFDMVVTNSQGSAHVTSGAHGPVVLVYEAAITACPTGPQGPCTSPPAFGPRANQFTPHAGMHCGTVFLQGSHFGCLDATVTVAGLRASRVDAWFGESVIAITVPAAGADHTIGSIVVTTTQGSATSDDQFLISGAPVATCAP
jgi:hypothetical protein